MKRDTLNDKLKFQMDIWKAISELRDAEYSWEYRDDEFCLKRLNAAKQAIESAIAKLPKT